MAGKIINDKNPFSIEWKKELRKGTFGSDYKPESSYQRYFSSEKIFTFPKDHKITAQKRNEIFEVISDIEFPPGFTQLKEKRKKEIAEAMLRKKIPSLLNKLTEEEKDEIIGMISSKNTLAGEEMLAEEKTLAEEKKEKIVEAILTTKFPSLFIESTEEEKKEIIKIISSINPRFIGLAKEEKKEIIEMIKNGFPPGFKKLTKEERRVYFEIISALKENGYIIDISFLESLDKDKKILLAKLFMYDLKDRLGGNFVMGKSLLIWMSRLFTENLKDDIFNISRGFNSFSAKYFMQAYNFLLPDINPKIERTSDQLFAVIVEYNLINNLDNDVSKIGMSGRLGNNFSLRAFHITEGVGKLEYKVDENKVDKNGKPIKNNTQNGTHNDTHNDTHNVDASNINNKTQGETVPYKKFNIHLATPTSICLFYKNNPVAIISFYIKNGTEFIINQIQEISYEEHDKDGNTISINHAKVLDNKKDRKNLLYDAAKSIAQKHGIGDVTLQC